MNNNTINTKQSPIYKLSLFLYLLLFFGIAKGQTINRDSIPQKDIVDFFRFKTTLSIQKDSANAKSKGPFISLMPAAGYTMLSGLTGTFVISTSFYTDSNKTKLSSILLNSNYSQYSQYWFILNTNFYFEKYKLHFTGDMRYYKFPTKTYGLDINNKRSDALAIDYSYLRIYQLVYREIRKNLYLGLGYNLDYHWNIKSDSLPTKTLNDFKKYNNNKKSSTSTGISVNILFDNRLNSVNPKNGYYALIQYRPNFKAMGSDSNWQNLLIDIRHYIPFPKRSKNTLCFWSYNKVTLKGTAPYLDLPSIGWDEYSNSGRGYVPGRFIGKNLFYAETEYRYTITRNGFFGGVVFCNAQTTMQDIKSKFNTIIPGAGFGLRFKINKRSNTNLAIDYGFGIGGSRGLIFNLGEVF